MDAATCDNLSNLSLPQTAITMAASVRPGAFAPPPSFSLRLQPGDVAYKDLPAFCRVAATLRPSSRLRNQDRGLASITGSVEWQVHGGG